MLILTAGLPRASLGVEVRNLATGLMLFDSAGFENDTVGNAPSAASPGNWVAYPPLDVVTNAGSPGAGTGSKYLATSRNAMTAGGPRAFFASQQIPGQQIRISFMLRVPSGVDGVLVLENSATFYRGLGRITGGRYYNYNGI